ncbi:MAG: PilZ domain-containing protein, partial [Sphingomonadales bacterium]
AFWAGINIVVLFLAAMLCLGQPARRAEERFGFPEQMAVWRKANGQLALARGIDLSLSGIALAVEGLERGEAVRVRIAGVGSLDGVVARSGTGRDGQGLAGIAFDGQDSPARDRLIERLFAEGGNTLVKRIGTWAATRAMLARIFTADTSLPPLRPTPAPPAPAPEVRLEKATLVLPPAAALAPVRRLG